MIEMTEVTEVQKMDAHAAAKAAIDFAHLFCRPRNYFKLSPQEQWSIDKRFDLLDIDINPKYISDQMRNTWAHYFS